MRDVLEPRVIGPGFRARVYGLVRTVPAGRITTYGDVGTLLGSPRVARQVGWALAALVADCAPDGEPVPWHRVINSKGHISYRGDTTRGEEQYARLAAEGVTFDDNGKTDLEGLRWRFEGVELDV